MESKKKYHKEVILTADGSVDPNITPEDILRGPIDDDDLPQICVKAEKQEEGQDVGLTFKKIDANIYVSGIKSDSIFRDSELELGDRICSVNDTNFMSYADPTFAVKLLNKKKVMECVMYVERGWNRLKIPDDVDACHYDKNPGAPKSKPAPPPEPEPEPEPEDSESEPEPEPEPKKETPPPPKKKEPLEKMWWEE
eukprot:scaffold321_cov95-Cylindrotheca_fusiformis.AAC.6